MLLISYRLNMYPKCPCAVLLCYAALAKCNLESLEFVFQDLSFSTSKGYSLRSITSLSYTRVREVVLAKFRAIGVDTSRMGLHSLRISGASVTFNSGVHDHVIQNHGRWKSDCVKNYIAVGRGGKNKGFLLLLRA